MLGKLTIADDFMERIEEGFSWLPIELRHIKELRTLPSIHRDPFGRMLVAPAKCESMLLLIKPIYDVLPPVEPLPDIVDLL